MKILKIIVALLPIAIEMYHKMKEVKDAKDEQAILDAARDSDYTKLNELMR